MAQQELAIVFEHERFRFENPNGDVIVGEGRDADGKLVFVKGPTFGEDPRPGVSYLLAGRWSKYTNKRSGQTQEQFHYQSLVITRPISTHAKATYLQQIKGIGPATAARIVEWCDGNLDALRNVPEIAANEVRGLSLEAAERAAAFLEENLALETTQIALLELFHKRGFPKKLINQCIETWGVRAADKVHDNPYLLMRFRGCGFKLTDKLYCALGHPPERKKRQAYCLLNAINRDTSGDTWYTPDQLRYALEGAIGGCRPEYERVVRILHRKGWLVSRYVDDPLTGMQWISTANLARDEETIAERLADLANHHSQWPETVPDVSDHQREVLRGLMRSPVCILGGGGGVGKTHCVARILKWAIAKFGKASVAACAPTGKAAVRITVALQEYEVPLLARTIHSLLGVVSADDGWEFEHNEANPLPYKVIVVDETSMVDNSVMRALLQACEQGTHVLFVGDVGQLPPVGRGAPLRDMIGAGVPYGELTETHRNAGTIVEACKKIRQGSRFSFDSKPDAQQKRNLLNIRATCDTAESVREGVHEAIRWAAEQGYSPIWDCQVVVPLNKKGPANRKDLNTWMQSLLNANPETKLKFRLGDKVICTDRMWAPPVEPIGPLEARRKGIMVNQYGRVLIANGDMGKVVEIDEGERAVTIDVQSPDRLVRIKGFPNETEAETEEGEESEGEGRGPLSKWTLAYALSCHKSQGAQFPVAIVVIDGAARICNREWWYTAISRAQHWCICVGDPGVIFSNIRQTGIHTRKTFLREEIQEQCGALLASPSYALS